MRLFLVAVIILYLAGCETPSTPGALVPGEASRIASEKLKGPVVIAVDYDSNRLLYWPMGNRGSSKPTYLSGLLHVKATAMVANGDVVTISSEDPAELLSYDVTTHATRTIADKYGQPLDVAIGKTGTLYALNESNVAVFPDSSPPYDLSCPHMRVGYSIAVDDAGDIFVNGYGDRHAAHVVEYPAGSSTCVTLPLTVKEEGYPVGVGIDPKTENLIVGDYGGCAGGIEGRITVYEPPYGSKIAAQHFLHASCPSNFRLDATSSTILVLDSFSGLRTRRPRPCGILWVDQRSYPNPKGRSAYTNGCARAVTTIPNILPN
jgi:hypothetical protein